MWLSYRRLLNPTSLSLNRPSISVGVGLIIRVTVGEPRDLQQTTKRLGYTSTSKKARRSSLTSGSHGGVTTGSSALKRIDCTTFRHTSGWLVLLLANATILERRSVTS